MDNPTREENIRTLPAFLKKPVHYEGEIKIREVFLIANLLDGI